MDLRNGQRPKGEFPSAGKPNGQKEMRPEDYTLEANQRAGARTQFVSQVAFIIFQENWKAICAKEMEVTDEELSDTMDEAMRLGELWRQKVNAYMIGQAETFHNDRVQQAAKSNLIIPTWGEIKDHFPGGMLGGGVNLG